MMIGQKKTPAPTLIEAVQHIVLELILVGGLNYAQSCVSIWANLPVTGNFQAAWNPTE